MTNNEDGSFDFDPNVDYVAQVREEQGKLGGVVFEGGSTAPTPQIEVADPVYEQGVLDAVAESLDATAPTPEMIAEMKKQMAEIDQGLRGEDRISLYQMRAIADQIRAYSPQQQYEVAAAMREHKAVRNFWGDDHPKTLEAMDHANKVSMPREINKETVVTAEASTTNEKEGSGPTQGEVEDIEIIRQNLNAPVLGSLEEKSLSNPVDDRFASMERLSKQSSQKRADKYAKLTGRETTEEDIQFLDAIADSFDLRSLNKILSKLGDIKNRDGYVYNNENMRAIINSLKGSNDPNLQRVTNAYKLRDTVQKMLLQKESL